MPKKYANNERIIRRVKGLLKLAEDNSNMEESQSAFMQAQQMMIKYGVDPADLQTSDTQQAILTKAATSYKRLFWWERLLADIISRNFRCSWYYSGKYFTNTVQVKRKIVFVGFEADIELATEMYKLASSALQFYTKKFMKGSGKTSNAKNDYMRGFIDGLEKKFEEQIENEMWGLIVVVPEEVKNKTKAITKGGKALSFRVPQMRANLHYEQGFTAGNMIDYTKSSLDKSNKKK